MAVPARAAAPPTPEPDPVGRRPGLLSMFRRRPRGAAPQPAAPTPPPRRAPSARPAATEAVLTAALDGLGSAQKRPFSR